MDLKEMSWIMSPVRKFQITLRIERRQEYTVFYSLCGGGGGGGSGIFH